MAEILTLTVATDQPPMRLDRWITQQSQREELSRTRIKALILSGQMICDGHIITDPSLTVKPCQTISLTIPDTVAAIPQAEAIDLNILFEDEHLICIDKPAGMVVHPAPGAISGTLVNALLAHCGDSLTGIGGVARPGIVHRLDKDTSGVMIAAKTDRAHIRLTEMFAAHDLDRRYQAIIWGMPAERTGRIELSIGRHPQDRKRQTVTLKGRHAITHYTTLRDLPPFGCHVECKLETGRTHQIRVHLSHIGHGVIGDQLYGRAKRANQMPDRVSREGLEDLRKFTRQALHAVSLSFAHPVTGQNLSFSSALPADITRLLQIMDAAISKRATSG